MRGTGVHPATIAVVLAMAAAPAAYGQSLAEIAQKEKERRAAAKAKPQAVKTYGDQDLAGYAGERPAEGTPGEEAPAMSATPKSEAPAAKEAKKPVPDERREKEVLKAEADELRARWRAAQRRVADAEERVSRMETEMKTLPPGLPAGNYRDDILAAVEQQKADRELRYDLSKKALAAAKEALDTVETEARRKQIRLD